MLALRKSIASASSKSIEVTVLLVFRFFRCFYRHLLAGLFSLAHFNQRAIQINASGGFMFDFLS